MAWNSEFYRESLHREILHLSIRTVDPLSFLQTRIQAGYHPNLQVEQSELYSCHLNVHLLGHQSPLKFYFMEFWFKQILPMFLPNDKFIS